MRAHRPGSVGFKLLVKSMRPLKRADIDAVSKLLAQDIETYGPLEINGHEVTLNKPPEVLPSERKSALGKYCRPGGSRLSVSTAVRAEVGSR